MALVSGYTGPKRSFGERMIAAAKLDPGAYEEVEADTSATGQAAGVVVISAIAAAIGTSGLGMFASVGTAIFNLVAWLIWSGITYLIGAKAFHGTATWGELLRTIGFAQTPGILYLFAFLPVIGWVIQPVVAIWVLIAGMIAIRQALDISTGKAIAVAILGWLVLIVPRILLNIFT